MVDPQFRVFVAIALKRQIARYRKKKRFHVAARRIPALWLAKQCQEAFLSNVFRTLGISR